MLYTNLPPEDEKIKKNSEGKFERTQWIFHKRQINEEHVASKRWAERTLKCLRRERPHDTA